jgi:predicted ATPase
MKKRGSKIKVPKWYVITGGPSSGKTTVIEELAKLGYITFPEAARILIDQEIAEGKSIEEIRANEIEFQKRVFRLNLKILKKAPRDKVVFFDRALPDSIAYYRICGLDPKEILKHCKRKIYKKVFFLEQLPLKRDYARIENGKTVKKLNKLLKKTYRSLGYEVITVPKMSVKKRVQKILKEIKKDS